MTEAKGAKASTQHGAHAATHAHAPTHAPATHAPPKTGKSAKTKPATSTSATARTQYVQQVRTEVASLASSGDLASAAGKDRLAQLGIWKHQYQNLLFDAESGAALTTGELDRDVNVSNTASQADLKQSTTEHTAVRTLTADGSLSAADTTRLEHDGVSTAQVAKLRKELSNGSISKSELDHTITSHNVSVDRVSATKLESPAAEGTGTPASYSTTAAPGGAKLTTEAVAVPGGPADQGGGGPTPTKKLPKSVPATEKKLKHKGVEIAVTDNDTFVSDIHGSAVRQEAFDKLKTMGVNTIRADIEWGKQDTPAQLAQYDDFIKTAHANGFKVELRLEGGAAAWTGGKGVDPDPKAFGSWVKTITQRFSKEGVDSYSIWSEPNLAYALKPDGKNTSAYKRLTAEAKNTKDPAKKQKLTKQAHAIATNKMQAAAATYADLYKAGYDAIKGVDPKAEVLYGELAAKDTAQFLKDAVNDAGGTVRADGIAVHPYQFKTAPNQKAKKNQNGIGNLKPVNKVIAKLTSQGKLAKPGATGTGKNARPDLDITEIGYQRQRAGFTAGDTEPEPVRATWAPKAYAQALKDGVKEISWWQILPADPSASWDTSILTIGANGQLQGDPTFDALSAAVGPGDGAVADKG